MIKVEFNSEVNGVTEVICHHTDFIASAGKIFLQLHFTKVIKWLVDPVEVKCSTGADVVLI